jgi:hypothetical protein
MTKSPPYRRLHAVIDGKRVPHDHEAARHIAQNAHLLALGDPKRAAEMVAEDERAKAEATNNNGASSNGSS